jgi:hypothetical protein
LKDAYYFPHDSNARHDPKIVTLCSRYGLVAYACYFQAIEILREQKNYELDQELGKAITTSWQSYSNAITPDITSKIFDDMFKFDLLKIVNGKIISPSLIERMSHLEEIRRKRSEAGKAGAAKLWQSHGTPMAVKESKVKKRIYTKPPKAVVLEHDLDLPPQEKNGAGAEIRKVVMAWKVVSGYAEDDKSWDKLYFARSASSAKKMIEFLGNGDSAVNCIQDIHKKFKEKNLAMTLETIVKHSADWNKNKVIKERII